MIIGFYTISAAATGRTTPRTRILLLFLALLCLQACENPTPPEDYYTDEELYSYSNNGNVLYSIDPNTFSVTDTITISMPEGYLLHLAAFSSDKNYILFSSWSPDPPFTHYIVSYDIENDSLLNMFATGFDSVGATHIFPAHNPAEPGLIYMYSHLLGLYSIDFLAQQVVECISPEHYQSLGKEIKYSDDKQYAGVLKRHGDYGEIEIYETSSGLYEPLAILNEGDVDSASVYDFEFSKDNQLIYVVYQLSKGRSRGIRSYFGVYDVRTSALRTFDVELPWFLSGYHTAQSFQHDEIYTVGGGGLFYVIDLESEQIENTIILPGITRMARIGIIGNEKIAFISCPDNDYVIAIDLGQREIVETIIVPHPYLLLIR